jgi:outer membrane protein insertion porin family
LLCCLGAIAALGPRPVAAQPGDSAVGGERVVAVLPFRVHSAKPVDYLGASLANLIRTRLEARGGVRVLDPDEVAGAPEGRVSDAALRRIAQDVGADIVVSGSLTELAGQYSLDVRVTPRAIGLRSHTLVLTARRDDELLARVNELADQVLEQVMGAEAAIIANVRLVGPPEVVQDLEARLTTKIGGAYDPATVRDDLAMLREVQGVANAVADTERGPRGVSVRFQVVGSQRILTEPIQEEVIGQRIAEVRVRGNRRIEADAIKARIKTQPGNVYSSSQVAKDLTAVYRLGFFANVRVFRDASAQGLIVTFQVEENPVVRQISISGNENMGGDDIRDILTLTTGSSLDYPLLYENRSRIEAIYRSQGYYLAEVSYEIEPLGEASVSIDFIVNEGEKLKLREINFVGNEILTDSELRQGFQTRPWRFWSYATSWFDRSGTYSEPLFIQDLRSVEKRYHEAGYPLVEVEFPEVDPVEDGLVVTVKVTEGEQFHVGGIDVAGDRTVDLDALREKLQLKEGEIFNRTFLTEDIESLRRHYTERGFFLAEVTPLSDLSEEERTVDVIFQVQKGPLYFIREIGVSGNTRSVDKVVRREIPIVEGQLYSSRAVTIARARLERLGFFEEVDLRPEQPDDPQAIDLEVDVVERPTGSFSFGAGFSSRDSFQIQGSLAESNLFGRGYGLNLTAEVGAQNQRFFLQFSDPYFLGSDFSLSTTIFRTSVRFEDFEQDQTGASLVFGHSLSEDNRTRGFARYNLNSREVKQDNNVDASGLIFREILAGSETISSVGLSFDADYRNDRLSPTAGYQLGGALEFAGLGGFAKFVRVEGRGSYYIPAPWWMPKRSAFVLRGSFGYALPLNEIADFNFEVPTDITSQNGQVRSIDLVDTDSVLPLSERYFLGGLGQFQLRGFESRSVGPLRPILQGDVPAFFDDDGNPIPTGAPLYAPVGYNFITGACAAPTEGNFQGDGDGKCNDIDAEDLKDFSDLDETDVIGGNKFLSASVEYRFPISDTLGLQGIVFLDTGNAFAEGDSMFDVDEWRWGTGGGVQWFSPFGPLTVILGFPLDPLPIDDSPVFEFSVGSGGF